MKTTNPLLWIFSYFVLCCYAGPVNYFVVNEDLWNFEKYTTVSRQGDGSKRDKSRISLTKEDDTLRYYGKMEHDKKLTQQVKDLIRIMESISNEDAVASRNAPLWTTGQLNAYDSSVLHKTWAQVKDILFHLTCDGCKILVATLQEMLALNKTHEEIVKEFTKACIVLHVEDNRVCHMVTREFQNEVLTVFDKLATNSSEVCGLLVGDACAKTYNPDKKWNVTFPNVPKPPLQPLVSPEASAPKLRILHVSDIHLDFWYKPGSNSDCGEPTCCRRDNGAPANASMAAGYWGDYRNCDTSTWLLESLFKHLQENETFDAIYWTGDLPGHNVWNQSRADQTRVQDYVNSLFMKYFRGKLVLPSVGNHESAPVNSFPPPFIRGNNSISWLYDVLANNWTHWLPKDTDSTIRKGGYYTMLLKPGFRIISLNINDCSNKNWWLLLNMTDPAGQLEWLINILQYAENNHEKVHILGHIPTGVSTCVKYWSHNYYKIVNRYENVIRGQFFGHTHHDEFVVYYDEESNYTRPCSVAYIGPSVTPYNFFNPGYRIYTVDGLYSNSTFRVLDHETYIVNLTEANLSKNPPTWRKEYSMKEAFSMKTLFPADWDHLVYRLLNDTTLFNQFHKYYWKLSPSGDTWDEKTRFGILCSAVSGRSNDPHVCDRLNKHSTSGFMEHKEFVDWQGKHYDKC